MKLTPKQAWECLNEFYKPFVYSFLSSTGKWGISQIKPYVIDYSLEREKRWDVSKIVSLPLLINIDWSGDWKDSLHYKGDPVNICHCGMCEKCKEHEVETNA